MVQGITDEAVVAIKLVACEVLVTELRVKPQDSLKEEEAKGGTH